MTCRRTHSWRTTTLLNKYVDKRLAEGASRSTVNRELCYLRSAMRRGWKMTSPPKVTSVPHFPVDLAAERRAAKTSTITDEQYAAIYPCLPPMLKPILPIGCDAAVRIGEALCVRWEQCDFSRRRIHLRKGETKNGEARTVPMTQRIHDALVEAVALRHQECVWLFHHNGERMSKRRFYELWDKACVEAGVYTPLLDADGNVRHDKKGRPLLHRPIHFHDARRTAVSTMGEMEVSDTDAQKVSGYTTHDMLMRYNRDATAVDRIRERLDEHMARKRGKTGTSTDVLEKLATLPADKLEAILRLLK